MTIVDRYLRKQNLDEQAEQSSKFDAYRLVRQFIGSPEKGVPLRDVSIMLIQVANSN